MKVIRFLAKFLMVVGALNWGLIGFFQYDLVSDIFGGMSTMGARLIFGLVGLAGLLGIGSLFGCGSCGCGCKCGPSGGCCSKKEQ